MSETVHLKPIRIDELPHTGHPLAGSQWAHIKQMNGWDAHPFYLSSRHTYLLVLSKSFTLFRIGYVPYADLSDVSPEELKEITEEVRRLTSLHFLFIRYELSYGSHLLITDKVRGVHRCDYSIQPSATVMIDLPEFSEDARSSYAKRAKRALRKSREAGADTILYHDDPPAFDRWYQLYQETSVRDGFGARSKAYIEGVMKQEGANLFLALHEHEIVGGVITLENEDHMLYLFGATARDLPFSAGYLLQDAVISYACDAGLKVYDLHGIGEEGHHLSSLNLFKTSFGGHIEKREKSVDVVCNPLMYPLYRKAEEIRLSRAREH